MQLHSLVTENRDELSSGRRSNKVTKLADVLAQEAAKQAGIEGTVAEIFLLSDRRTGSLASDGPTCDVA